MPDSKNENIGPLQYLKGVGPARAKALADAGITTLRDLLFYFPRDYVDRSDVASLKALQVIMLQEFSFTDDIFTKAFSLKREVSIIATIKNKREHSYGRNKKMLSLVLVDGSGGSGEVIFWSFADFYSKQYQINDNIIISGKPEINNRQKIVFTHPEIEKFEEDESEIYSKGGILPIYPLTQSMRNTKMTMKHLRTIMHSAIDSALGEVSEILPGSILKKYGFPQIRDAIRGLHFPKSRNEIDTAIGRMKYQEVFLFEVYLALRSKGIKVKEKAPVIDPKSKLARQIFEGLPFELTSDQKKVIREISNDMQSGKPMNRLLQGDVGSGKTIVALLSMLVAIDHGYQAAFLAPTEILAEQHYHSLLKYLEHTDVKIAQLMGGQKNKLREKINEEIKNGNVNIIVGTHALFEGNTEYNKLGMVVIDEQHRFGVTQRAELKALARKSFGDEDITPHILVMSATPIPRTLSMTLYGDLEVSVIKEMPSGRKPIKTKVIFESQIEQAFSVMREEISKGHQGFIVYPLVEKSEKMELKAATEFYEELKSGLFREYRCGLLHGQMFWYEKDEVMKDFLARKYDILVATTVIEVGIDIPNATIMIIENAERYGLSQLHQLRGRVGRGDDQSYCLLIAKDHYKYFYHKKEIPEEERKAAVIRLSTMERTTDGFVISEVDLKLRGPGDVMGTRQSGLPAFKYLDLANDSDLIARARLDAFELIDRDGQLKSKENEPIRKEFIKQYREDKIYFDIA